MSLSAAEQYLLELINQSRLDPLGEAANQGIGLNTGITEAMGGDIQTTPMQVLAPNTQLHAAADEQTEYLLDTGYFTHTGEGGSSAGDRMIAAGFTSPITYRENLSASSGSLSNMETVMQGHHDALYASPGHRAAIFDANQTDIGIGEQDGRFRGRDTSMLTEVFAAQAGNRYVTGVAYTDSDRDDFYSIGEGLSGVTFETTNQTANTAVAGGYALDANSTMTDVSILQDGATIARVSIDTSDGNAKLDLIVDTRGDYTLAVSTDTVLMSGIDDARLLGVGHLDLTGHDGDNKLLGNSSKNKLFGGAGDDVIKGYGGRDKLYGDDGADKLIGGGGKDKLFGDDGNDNLIGGGGKDVLRGGAGDDRLKGGGGADKFVFDSGDDLIRDFKDDVDTIQIDRALVNGSRDIDDVLDRGQITGGNAVFDFGGDHQLTVRGVTDLDDLRNDLVIV